MYGVLVHVIRDERKVDGSVEARSIYKGVGMFCVTNTLQEIAITTSILSFSGKQCSITSPLASRLSSWSYSPRWKGIAAERYYGSSDPRIHTHAKTSNKGGSNSQPKIR